MRHALPGNGGILLALLVTTSTDILAQHVHVSAPPRSSQDTTVGTIVFPNSGAAAAQSSFLRGVAIFPLSPLILGELLLIEIIIACSLGAFASYLAVLRYLK